MQRNLSEEMSEWVKLIREHWFQESDEVWTSRKQFIFTFLGAFTYFTVVFTTSLISGVAVFQIEILFATIEIFYIWTVVIVILSVFFGSILAWLPRKTGPVRLYLSGVALPALVMSIIVLPYRFE